MGIYCVECNHGRKRESSSAGRREATTERMRDVAQKSLEEDVACAAVEALQSLQENEKRNSSTASGGELMQYSVKGSDDQWSRVLHGKDLEEGTGTVQIQTIRAKRKAVNEETTGQEMQKEKICSKVGRTNKKKSKKRNR